mgnify:CR=1 FL=1
MATKEDRELKLELKRALEHQEHLELVNDRLQKELFAMEARVDELRRMLAGGAVTGGDAPSPAQRSAVHEKIFRAMTTKQHVVMQCVLLGLSNKEIETRMGVQENTVKTYVRGMLGKFGLSSRHQLEGEVKDALNSITDADYEAASSGLPKTWARDWVKKDPHKKLYYGKTK